jgi:hypothetical protein
MRNTEAQAGATEARRQNERSRLMGGFFQPVRVGRDYFSWVEMLVNLVFKVEPIVLTTAMMATEMPAAMRPYSMAVAPDSFFRNATSLDM